ncbi:MAG: diguanylate cyclase [Campylobacteraceae bacterium]|nr:diguanylate cyclase [Campylobacteraceae bacterium]
MQTVLIVDDSKFILNLLEDRITELLNVRVLKAASFQAAKEFINKEELIHVAILDLNLPDANDGDMVDYAISNHIPSIVLTGLMNEQIKKTISRKDIVDYVYKNNRNSIEYTINVIHRVLTNYNTHVLVIDDPNDKHEREIHTLAKIKLNIEIASSIEQTLELCQNHSGKYALILIDDTMQHIDAIGLTIALRQQYKKDQLSIIVLGENKNSEASCEFIKFGANDFIEKPFSEIEFISRVNANLDLVDSFKQAKNLANRDYLSGAYNRRFLFESGSSIFKKAKRKKENIALAMIDIDDFKHINDTYGHDVGDLVIKSTVNLLNTTLRTSDLMVRFGGEEFCILLEYISIEDTEILFEKIREKFEKHIMKVADQSFGYTVSIGICFGLGESLEDMIKKSDDDLYKAKRNGKNQVCISKI